MRDWFDVEAQRKKVGLSQAEMCRRAGISVSAVAYGKARRSHVSNAVRDKLAAVFAAEQHDRRVAS